MNVILLNKNHTISYPTTVQRWDAIRTGFESKSGIPNAVGAIDGSLIEIERPADYDGWYNRKGYPSFNLLAIVDHQKRFMYVSIKPGSNNDKSVFNNSFRRIANHILPANCYLLADAGYDLMTFMMTPYPIRPGMARDEATYNYLHSRARMVVEMAFGLLKMKFAILKTALNFKSKAAMGKVIVVSMILHNWLIDLNEVEEIDPTPMVIEDYQENNTNQINDEAALTAREMLKQYLVDANIEV
jgi:hypothetical protein